MSKKTLKQLIDSLNRAITDAIRFCVRKGPCNVDDVEATLKKEASMLIDQVAVALGWLHIRIMIQRKLKRVSMTVAQAEAADRQLNLTGMEEFKGIPPQITYFDKSLGRVEYVSYSDSESWQREAALRLLDENMAADRITRAALAAGNQFASSLVAIYGELPLRELIALWLADKTRRSAGA